MDASRPHRGPPLRPGGGRSAPRLPHTHPLAIVIQPWASAEPPTHAVAMSRSPLPVFTWLLFATTFPPFAAHAQQVPEIPAPSDTVYEIRLGDGTLVFARIAAVDGERVEFTTVDGGRMEVDHDQIHELRPARGRVVGSQFWHEDPAGNRLFLTPTGRALRRGEWHLGTFAILMPFAALGVTDHIAISAGVPAIFVQQPFFVGPKVQVVRRPTVQAALGTIALLDLSRWTAGGNAAVRSSASHDPSGDRAGRPTWRAPARSCPAPASSLSSPFR